MLEEIWRYPVKSMQGEAVERVAVGLAGVAGDRGWAVRDVVTGNVASAKLPRRFGALLHCTATSGADPSAAPRVTLPDGQTHTGGDPTLDAQLGELLGRSVELVDADQCGRRMGRVDPTGDDREFDGTQLSDPTTSELGAGVPGAPTLVDYAAVHLVARSTLAHLASVVGDDGAAVARFRPNLTVDVDVPAFGENDWVGRVLVIGEVTLTVTAPTPRCVLPTLPLAGHDESSDTMRALAARNRPQVLDRGARTCLGVYASVAHPGTLHRSDPVAVHGAPVA